MRIYMYMNMYTYMVEKQLNVHVLMHISHVLTLIRLKKSSCCRTSSQITMPKRRAQMDRLIDYDAHVSERGDHPPGDQD